MDTPVKTQITTPLSKIEDSPIFNYINSLSPIKPVKSIHITQPFHSISFGSLPFVFTSPHVCSHKESRSPKRDDHLDSSKPEFLYEQENRICSHEGIVVDQTQPYDNSAEMDKFDPGVSISKASSDPPTEHLNFAIELPQTLKYDCGSPECDPTPCCGTQMDCASELLARMPESCGPFVKEDSEESSPDSEVHLEGIQADKYKKEDTECDWERLIPDTADMLVFDSPIYPEAFKGLIQKTLDPGVPFCNSPKEMHNMVIVDPVGLGQHEMEDPLTQHGETIEPIEMNQAEQSSAANEHPNKVVSNLHRGIRRRCLDFEVAGVHRKTVNDGSSSSYVVLVQSNENIASKDKQLVPVKSNYGSSIHILPGIGLHLNTLAITSKGSKNIKNEISSSGLSFPSSTASLHSPTTGQEVNDSLPFASIGGDLDLVENCSPLLEDVSQTSACLVSDELSHSSPQKKRPRLEGENEACKHCKCKKSKCLKLYCECFAAGVYCIEPCSCQDCFNNPIHEDIVLATRKQIESRNPLAFAPKVIRTSESFPEIGDESNKTPASARHKRGCNCKKSGCLKKYCECYQGGVGCSINCRCEGCKNAFGRKDDSAVTDTEAEPEEETAATEKTEVKKISHKMEIQNIANSGDLPTTPLQLCRPLIQQPFSSKGKPLRSSLGMGSSTGLCLTQKHGKPNILPSQPKFEKQSQTVPNDDMLNHLRGSCSTGTIIKTSPKSKRVTSPHIKLLSSPGWRSGRKLILQSIPSFPELTPQP